MILHQFPPLPGQDSLSSFCTKAQRCLRARGLQFDVRNEMSGRQISLLNPGIDKLPVLELDDGRTIVDSTTIARWADDQGTGAPLLPTEPTLRRRVEWLEDWADESLYWFLVYHRWQIDAHFAAFASQVLADLPAFVRPVAGWVARRRLLRDLHGQGLGRLPAERVFEQFCGHLDRLDSELAGRPWLVAGDGPTVADLAVFGILQGFHTPALAECAAAIDQRTALSDWAARVDVATTGPHTVPWSAG